MAAAFARSCRRRRIVRAHLIASRDSNLIRAPLKQSCDARRSRRPLQRSRRMYGRRTTLVDLISNRSCFCPQGTNDVPVAQFRASAAAVVPAPPAAVSAHASEETQFAHDECVERLFWKQLAQGHGAFYGADMLGSLFDADAAWNMARLDNLLQALPRVVGINEPYLYWGSWRAMFAWHVEDKDLFSINYLHFGEPKSWYGINPELADFFEGYCQSFFEMENLSCPEFLRHKFCMVDPAELNKHEIVVQRTTQRVGEFVVTFPRAYHAGFNHGFNCAEAVKLCVRVVARHGRCRARLHLQSRRRQGRRRLLAPRSPATCRRDCRARRRAAATRWPRSRSRPRPRRRLHSKWRRRRAPR
jgi:hypothetical protein